jgi:hypothetical protein
MKTELKKSLVKVAEMETSLFQKRGDEPSMLYFIAWNNKEML